MTSQINWLIQFVLQMADLEQRLERLEAVIGQNPEKLSSLTKDAANKSLVVSFLQSKF